MARRLARIGFAAAPRAEDLSHLRPADDAGLLVVAVAVAGTTLGLALSFAGGWLPWLGGQVALAFAVVQWFVILHECGHETLFRTRRHHAWVGGIAAFVSIIPYHAWRRVHGRHHKWTGWQDLDPTTESLVPRELGRAERLLVNACWRLWLPLFSILYRVSNFWNLPRLWTLFPRPSDRRAIVRDAAILLAAYLAFALWLGPAVMLRGCGLALVLGFIIEDLLLLSQHTHVPQQVSHGAEVRPFPAIEQAPFTRSLRLPRLASAFVLHFDAHELHHMYPFVPGYCLRHIDFATDNEIGWWEWVTRAKQLRAEVLLFQNRIQSGWDI